MKTDEILFIVKDTINGNLLGMNCELIDECEKKYSTYGNSKILELFSDIYNRLYDTYETIIDKCIFKLREQNIKFSNGLITKIRKLIYNEFIKNTDYLYDYIFLSGSIVTNSKLPLGEKIEIEKVDLVAKINKMINDKITKKLLSRKQYIDAEKSKYSNKLIRATIWITSATLIVAIISIIVVIILNK